MDVRSRASPSTTSSASDKKAPVRKAKSRSPPLARPPYSWLRITAGWLVHLYTATGLLVNFYSLLHAFIIAPNFHLFAQLNWLAILIDATDGTLARAVDVKKVIPIYDGALLDNIIDFTTFSLLPALAIVRFELVESTLLQYGLASAVLISSAFAFCQTLAKTSEAFVGFPSYWNIVVFYLYYLQSRTSIVTAVVLTCAILSFIPLHFIYPTKTKAYMALTLTGAYIWGAMMVFPCFFPSHPLVQPVLNWSLVYVVYYTLMSLYLDNVRRRTSH